MLTMDSILRHFPSAEVVELQRLRTVAIYEPIPQHLDGVYPYSVMHDFPDQGLRVVIFYCYRPDMKHPEIWDSETGEVIN